jgi:hypothetical protein
VDPRSGLDAMARRYNPRSYRGLNHGRSARSVITILTELPLLVYWTKYCDVSCGQRSEIKKNNKVAIIHYESLILDINAEELGKMFN